ncbi:MAG TPA: sigma-70 family RNA polymerase sigma factor [Planctomycetota bacterium]|nr:sigma-70 family RNA polymerase sigma factor [Planctomycetota bacterium]
MGDLRELSDEDLALRARTEPHGAFEVLFERHRGPLYNFLLRQGADAGRVDDLFQVTFFKAFRALPGFREESRFKTWLYTIAVHVLTDDRRATLRRGPTTEIRETMLVTEPELPRRDEIDLVKTALDQVPANHRRLFTLVRFQGLPIAEAAKAVGMTPAAAKVTLFRTTRRVGELLSPAREKMK